MLGESTASAYFVKRVCKGTSSFAGGSSESSASPVPLPESDSGCLDLFLRPGLRVVLESPHSVSSKRPPSGRFWNTHGGMVISVSPARWSAAPNDAPNSTLDPNDKAK